MQSAVFAFLHRYAGIQNGGLRQSGGGQQASERSVVRRTGRQDHGDHRCKRVAEHDNHIFLFSRQCKGKFKGSGCFPAARTAHDGNYLVWLHRSPSVSQPCPADPVFSDTVPEEPAGDDACALPLFWLSSVVSSLSEG